MLPETGQQLQVSQVIEQTVNSLHDSNNRTLLWTYRRRTFLRPIVCLILPIEPIQQESESHAFELCLSPPTEVNFLCSISSTTTATTGPCFGHIGGEPFSDQ